MPLHEQKLKALLISVSFRSAETIRTLVESLDKSEALPALRVLIADNASGEETVDAIRRIVTGFLNIDLLSSPTNLGYFGAARLALDHYLDQGETLPEWVIVSNPDIVIEDRNFLHRLFKIDPQSVGVIAPRIVLPESNLDQNPYMKERPGPLQRFTMRVHSHDYFLSVAWERISRLKRALRSRLGQPRPAGGTQAIYAPHGAFIIFSREYFEAGGYLDDQLFLYGEEIAVGEICRRLGLPVVYNPSLTVFHNEHQSVGVGMTRAKFQHHRRSIRHVLSTYLAPRSVATKV